MEHIESNTFSSFKQFLNTVDLSRHLCRSISKLRITHICTVLNELLCMFCDALTCIRLCWRSQRVVLNGAQSHFLPVPSDVPQGGPWTSTVPVIYQRHYRRHLLRDPLVCRWLYPLQTNQGTSTVSHYSRTSTSCIIGLIPGSWPSIAKNVTSCPSLTNEKDRPCSTSLVMNVCLQLNHLHIFVLPSPVTSAGVSMSTICQSYKSLEFRSAQYLPLYFWSQRPSLHLIDQTTSRIRISSKGSLYRSWFTSAWQSAASGSTVRQKRLQADYISFRTYLASMPINSCFSQGQ